jgi:hypothetical protein
MKRVQWILGLLTENIGWKLLSLAIALVVWGMVADEPELSTFATVGVEYKNLPDDMEISSDPVSSVKLELRGPAGELRGAGDNGSSTEVILDMSDVRTGERTFPIGDGNVKLVSGVHFVRAIPSEVRLRFEPRAEKTIKVTPRFRERTGFELSEFTVTPDTIAIAGPASHVNPLQAVQTDQVNVPASEGSFVYSVNTFVDDQFVRFPGVSHVTVTITVIKKQGK